MNESKQSNKGQTLDKASQQTMTIRTIGQFGEVISTRIPVSSATTTRGIIVRACKQLRKEA